MICKCGGFRVILAVQDASEEVILQVWDETLVNGWVSALWAESSQTPTFSAGSFTSSPRAHRESFNWPRLLSEIV
jgi:hypothetical protein